MASLLDQEVYIVSSSASNNVKDNEQLNVFIEKFLLGQFEDILRSDLGKRILYENPSDTSKLCSLIKSNVEKLLLETSTDKDKLELEILIVGVACLQLFVQNNWLGPLTQTLPTEFIHPACSETVNKEALDELSMDGEPVYQLCRFLPYLLIAHTILLDCRDLLSRLQTSKWWLIRCLYIQQEVLDDRSPSLRSTIIELVDSITSEGLLFQDDKYRNVMVEFHLEVGHMCHIYYEYKQGKSHFNKAKELLGLEIDLTGALGKRTRFQQDDIAQLAMRVTRSSDIACPVNEKLDVVLPKIIHLDDDTLYNNINYTDKNVQFAPQLSPLEQSVVVGCMEAHRRNTANDRLNDEIALTYIESVLKQLCNWNVGILCLTLRSKLQKHSGRHVERSMMQLEDLVNQVSRNKPPILDRLPYFYCNRVPSIYNMKRELGALLVSLGCLSAAIDLYESIEMWEEAIQCYQAMGKTQQVEKVIRDQLEKQETPNLYCFLGDVTGDMQYYQKGWELSNQKSARAMRCMGYLHFSRGNCESALECFEKSLERNSLQIPVWFTYGCVALRMEKYDKAVIAFKKCVQIDSDNFEAWNNMGTAYIKLKDKTKAFLTMKEAVKYNFESWQLWENVMMIGTDCGEFDEVILAYTRLLDLQGKWVDIEVLTVLVRVVEEDMLDSKGRPSRRLLQRLKELFGRITSKTTGNGDIWRLYAKLVLLDNSPESIEKGLQYLQKSHRCTLQTSDWENNEKTCKEVSDQAIKLSKLYVQCSESVSDQTQKLQNLSSAKLMLKGVLSKIKQYHTDPVTQTLPAPIQELCTELDNQIQDVINKVEAIRNG